MTFPYQINSKEEYDIAYQKSISNPEAFWEEIASQFVWKKKWHTVLQWDFETPHIKWFDGAILNITENCLDRWASLFPKKNAIIWEPNHPEEQSISYTYEELLIEVSQLCFALQKMGVSKGDRICLYMPMIPALAIAVLACARIGAVHSVVFGGFSAQSIADRIVDASCKWIITADGVYRGEKWIPLKKNIDEALTITHSVEKVIVYNRTNMPIEMNEGRDVWWHEVLEEQKSKTFFPAQAMEAEDLLFILYTSGSTGKPKGVVHTCAGYMIYTHYTFLNVFQYQPNDIHFCTADIGWITGHSYILYGPLSAGATTLMYEGIPTYPHAGRLWDIVDKYKVNILYTAPTAIRTLMTFDNSYFENNNLQSLKTLGTVGEPINEEAWQWYYKNIGKEKCPIVDTWWQTETGGILISNIAGITPHIPSFATLPLPGIEPILLDEQGLVAKPNEQGITSGNLCISKPWPGMMRTTYNDHERMKKTYFSTYPGFYFTGDGCYKDEKGNYRITGRVDDVLNVSGHRVGTAEVENAINQHPNIVESAIVGYPHTLKGEGIYAYVVCNHHATIDTNLLHKQINEVVTAMIGAICKPDKIQIVPALPKTRSGKIMRRILRKIAHGEYDQLGDISTLLDTSVVEKIIQGHKQV